MVFDHYLPMDKEYYKNSEFEGIAKKKKKDKHNTEINKILISNNHLLN